MRHFLVLPHAFGQVVQDDYTNIQAEGVPEEQVKELLIESLHHAQEHGYGKGRAEIHLVFSEECIHFIYG